MALTRLTQPFGAVMKMWQRYRGDVRGWGAKGDGITDETEVLKEAMDSDEQNVLLPEGTFLVTDFRAKSEKNVSGQGRLRTTLTKTSGSVVQRISNTELQDFGMSDITIKAAGKGVNNAVCLDLALPKSQMKNQLRNYFNNFSLRDAQHGILTNSGWSTLLQNYRVTDCTTGYKSLESWVSSWGGSGNTSINGYYAACDTGIDTTTQWNQTWINTVIEYCDTPIYERGNNNTYINTWCEGNTNPIKLMRGSVFINGRGLDFDLSDITTTNNKECLTWINNEGINVVRFEGKSAIRVHGQGVEVLRGLLNGEAKLNFSRAAFAGSGENRGVSINLFSGGDTTELLDETKQIAGITMTANGDSEGQYGRIYFQSGRTNGGVSDNKARFELDWRGDLLPVDDNTYSFGKSGRSLKLVHAKHVEAVEGVIIKSSQSNKRWMLQVDDSGNITAVSAPVFT